MSIRPLSKELQKKAEDELNEVPGRIQEDLKNIREWLKKQPHLKVRDDDQWLTGFLRGCKFSLEQTKDKIDCFYTMRTLLPEIFYNRDPLSEDIQVILKENLLMMLPNPSDPAGPSILLYRWGASNPDKISSDAHSRIFFVIMDMLLRDDDNSTIAGLTCIIDLKNLSKESIMQWSPSLLQKVFMCFQGKYPIRVKGLHYINAPPIFSALFALIQTFLKEKIKKRATVTSENNINQLYQIIPQSVFPTEYGGDNGSMADLTGDIIRKLESSREWFLEDKEYRSNEKLRPGKPKTSSDMFGVEGSFRKLNID